MSAEGASEGLAPVDRYPSRVGGERGFVERPDPVVWGDADGPLDRTAVERYERDGFLVLPALLDEATVAACLELVNELASAPDIVDGDLAVREPESGTLRSLFDLPTLGGALADLTDDDRLGNIARQLLGSETTLHQSRINLKLGAGGTRFPWHSDFETWHVEDGMPSPRAVSASVALTENRAWNGPLLLIAGSHRRFLGFDGGTPDANHLESLRRQTYGVPTMDELLELTESGRIASFEGPPGSVAFFDSNIMHGSPDNISPIPRTNAFVCFNSVENALVEPFGGTRPRPQYLAAGAIADS